MVSLKVHMLIYLKFHLRLAGRKITFEEGVNKMLNEIENWKDAPLWTPDKIEKVTENWFKFLKK